MAEIVNGKFNERLANGHSVDIGNGYEIKSRFRELETYSHNTTINELSANNVFVDKEEIPAGEKVGRLETRTVEFGFIFKNAHNMLAKQGVPPEKREAAVAKYFQEARDFFLGKFAYIDPRLVIVAPDGKEIEPYSNSDRPIVRSDDNSAILAEQNTDLKFIEKNLVTILKNHYENEIEEAEEIVSASKEKLDDIEFGKNDFHFGDDNKPSGPGM